MDFMDTRIWILGIVAVLVLLGIAVWLRSRKKQSYRVEQGFGPEYGHAAADEAGSRASKP